MRAALNITLGLLLLVMQSMALVAPHSIEKAAACKCCSCGSDTCTTTRTAPAPTSPVSVQMQEARAEARKLSFRPAPRPSFPATAVRGADYFVGSVLPPDFLPFPPLYERYCFLLI